MYLDGDSRLTLQPGIEALTLGGFVPEQHLAMLTGTVPAIQQPASAGAEALSAAWHSDAANALSLALVINASAPPASSQDLSAFA